MRGAGQFGALLVLALVQQVDRRLVAAQHVLGAQRLGHGLLEPGLLQAAGSTREGSGGEARRDRHAEQGLDQRGGPLDGYVALGLQQHGVRLQVRAVDHRARLHAVRACGRDTPAGALQAGQLEVDALQGRREGVPDLGPAVFKAAGAHQGLSATAARCGVGDTINAIRLSRTLQAGTLAADLATGLAVLGTLTRGQLGLAPCLGRDRILGGRLAGVGGVTPQLPPQLGDSSVSAATCVCSTPISSACEAASSASSSYVGFADTNGNLSDHHEPHEFMAPGVAVTVGHIMKEGCFRPAMIQLL
ncbi:hypothetical protein ABIE67_009343 [Streptomyces sp. V4I8]